MKTEWHDAFTDPPSEGSWVWIYRGSQGGDGLLTLAQFSDGDYSWETITFNHPLAWTPLIPPAVPVRMWISSEETPA